MSRMLPEPCSHSDANARTRTDFSVDDVAHAKRSALRNRRTLCTRGDELRYCAIVIEKPLLMNRRPCSWS